MTDVIITWVRRDPRVKTHEGITHLGNAIGRWHRDQVIAWIEAKRNTFYTSANGKRADIAVVKGPNGKYLCAHANGAWTNNLLLLPEGP